MTDRNGRLPGWRTLLGATIAGGLLPFGFAPYGQAWLPPLCLAVLFSIWRRLSPRQAAVTGYLAGLGLWGSGIYWIHISIHDFGHVALGISLFLTALFIAFMALFMALAAALSSFLYRRFQLHRGHGFVMPLVWALVEWLRGWFLTGFPWLALGYSQIDTPLAALAPVVGVYGMGLIVALAAWCLVRLRDEFGRRRALNWLAAIVLIYGLPLALPVLSWTEPAGQSLRVSLVQGNIPQDIKWLPAMQAPTLELYEGMTRRHWSSDLVVWPESAVPLFLHEARPFLERLGAEARRHATDMLIGIISEDPDTGRYYNSVLALGTVRALYHKRHLVPFTEYLPLKGVLGGLVDILDVPMSDFSAGPTGQRPLPVAGQKAAISICYEDAFGEEAIDALPEATLLVNVSNDAWFGGSVAPAQHLQMARMRALETGRPLLRATNTGITAVVDARGDIVARAPQFEATVLDAVIQPRQGATPYVVWGNWPVVIVCLFSFGVIACRHRDSKELREVVPAG